MRFQGYQHTIMLQWNLCNPILKTGYLEIHNNRIQAQLAGAVEYADCISAEGG